jgi:ABC-type uncharacterized transport system permease subunit
VNTFIQAATVLLPTAYLVAAVLYGMAFAGERQPALALRLRRPMLAATLLLHGAMFLARGEVAGTFPINGAWLTVSATALATAALFVLVTWRVRLASVGGIVLGMVALLQTGASALGPVSAAPLPATDPVSVTHVLTVALAAAALVLSGLFGYLHLLLLRQMRRKSFGPVYRELPDLEQLIRLTRTTAFWGFLFMAAGLNVGIGMAHARGTEGFGYLDPHVLMTIAVWLHFGLIAFSRHIPGLTARRTSLAAAWGLLILLVTIALTLVPVTFHELG